VFVNKSSKITGKAINIYNEKRQNQSIPSGIHTVCLFYYIFLSKSLVLTPPRDDMVFYYLRVHQSEPSMNAGGRSSARNQ